MNEICMDSQHQWRCLFSRNFPTNSIPTSLFLFFFAFKFQFNEKRAIQASLNAFAEHAIDELDILLRSIGHLSIVLGRPMLRSSFVCLVASTSTMQTQRSARELPTCLSSNSNPINFTCRFDSFLAASRGGALHWQQSVKYWLQLLYNHHEIRERVVVVIQFGVERHRFARPPSTGTCFYFILSHGFLGCFCVIVSNINHELWSRVCGTERVQVALQCFGITNRTNSPRIA